MDPIQPTNLFKKNFYQIHDYAIVKDHQPITDLGMGAAYLIPFVIKIKKDEHDEEYIELEDPKTGEVVKKVPKAEIPSLARFLLHKSGNFLNTKV